MTTISHIEENAKPLVSNATKKKMAIICFAVAAILSVKLLLDLSAQV